MTTKVLFVHALTPLHAGIGSGTDVIDLPIAREKSTGLPYLPGSSIKGSLRSVITGANPMVAKAMFGPETRDASEHAGAVQFSDAYLLAMPIRSLAGMFAWVTSPYILRRLARDLQLAGTATPAIPTLKDTQVVVPPAITKLRVQAQKVVFEDIDLDIVESNEVGQWLTVLTPLITHIDGNFVAERFCVVSDDVLSFLLNTATEVRARVRLNDDKTVQTGALWYEESLPSETLLVGIVNITPNSKTNMPTADMLGALHHVAQNLVQFGGKTTTGHGFCRMMITK